VYVIHFDSVIDTPNRDVRYQFSRHYVGSALDLNRRLHVQLNGLSGASKLCKLAHELGIGMTVSRVFVTDPSRYERLDVEYTLKSRHNTPAYCPVCTGNNHRVLMLKREVEPGNPYSDVYRVPAAELHPDVIPTLVDLPF
jgi:hypothetical protein